MQIGNEALTSADVLARLPRNKDCLPFECNFPWKFLEKWICTIPLHGNGSDWSEPFYPKFPDILHFFSQMFFRLLTIGTELNFRKFRINGGKSNTLFPKRIHRNEPYYLNSHRNNWFSHANGKPSSTLLLVGVVKCVLTLLNDKLYRAECADIIKCKGA